MNLCENFYQEFPESLRPIFPLEFIHRKKPAHFSIAFDYFQNNKKYSLYLDIDSNGTILSVHYQSPENDFYNNPLFEVLARMCEGLPIAEAYLISNLDLLDFLEEQTTSQRGELWDIYLQMIDSLLPFKLPLVSIPILLLHNALAEFRGRELTFREHWLSVPNNKALKYLSLTKKSNSLICRCFGLFYSDIASLLVENKNLQLKDVTDQTMAGGGCASCVDQIEEAIEEWREELGIMPEVDWPTYTILGRSQAEWLFILEDLIREYLENKNIEKDSKQYGIISFKGHEIILQGPLERDVRKDLGYFLKKKAQVAFHIG